MTSYQKIMRLIIGRTMSHISRKPMKPAKFAENQLLEAILEGAYSPGQALPAERILAQNLGVTRPTLREALQRLAKEGWITIAHGKVTRVNDYLSQGGLGVLTTLARYGKYLSPEIIGHLLEARTLIFPMVAQRAVETEPKAVLTWLDTVDQGMDAHSFALYDWELQNIMVAASGNLVLRMMFNDFGSVYQVIGERYFTVTKARQLSLDYYERLKTVLEKGEYYRVGDVVKNAMEHSQDLWKEIV